MAKKHPLTSKKGKVILGFAYGWGAAVVIVGALFKILHWPGANEMLMELGQAYKLEMLGDSTACLGVLHREGVGRLKHISVKQLWLQERINSGQTKFKRDLNSADALTHHWQTKDMAHFRRIDLHPMPS